MASQQLIPQARLLSFPIRLTYNLTGGYVWEWNRDAITHKEIVESRHPQRPSEVNRDIWILLYLLAQLPEPASLPSSLTLSFAIPHVCLGGNH